MRTKEHRFHAYKNLLAFQRTDNGFEVSVLFEPDIELQDKATLEAFGNAPEISGSVVGFIHDFRPDKQITEIKVWSYRASDILKHAREYERNFL